MTTIKSHTDLSQSKMLAKILPLESADMVYFGIHQGMDGKCYLSGINTEDDIVPIYKNFCIKVFAKTTASDVINQLPCWSLAALLEEIPDTITNIVGEDLKLHIEKDELQYYLFYENEYTGDMFEIETELYDDMIDACYDVLMNLKCCNYDTISKI